VALNCKGKNKAGDACGMRPPKDKEWCIRHQGQAGGATTTTTTTEQKKQTTTVAGDLSALAAAGIGIGIGLLGLCVWLVWRPAKKPAAPAKPRQLRAA
jgi:hypothetical protein